jgi:hypothetical protein
VGEAHRQRLPPVAEELPDDPQQRRRRELQRLPGRRGLAELEPQPHGRQVAALVQPQPQRLVVAVLVPDQQGQRVAQPGLLPQHDAQRPQRGQPPQAGQPQAEVLAAGVSCRALQQPGDRRGGDPRVGDGEVRDVQPRLPQQASRVQAAGARETHVAVERRAADRGGHSASPPPEGVSEQAKTLVRIGTAPGRGPCHSWSRPGERGTPPPGRIGGQPALHPTPRTRAPRAC